MVLSTSVVSPRVTNVTFLSSWRATIADQPRKRSEQLGHRHHAQLQNGTVQFGHQTVDRVTVTLDGPRDFAAPKGPLNLPAECARAFLATTSSPARLTRPRFSPH